MWQLFEPLLRFDWNFMSVYLLCPEIRGQLSKPACYGSQPYLAIFMRLISNMTCCKCHVCVDCHSNERAAPSESWETRAQDVLDYSDILQGIAPCTLMNEINLILAINALPSIRRQQVSPSIAIC